MIELWQANDTGNYRSSLIEKAPKDFVGFGRQGTGAAPDHRFRFTTIKPGSVNGQAPHINVILGMRGSLRLLYTRIYFSDENNDSDPVWTAIEANRRHTLIAPREMVNKMTEYHFDIHMQGEKETVFFSS